MVARPPLTTTSSDIVSGHDVTASPQDNIHQRLTTAAKTLIADEGIAAASARAIAAKAGASASAINYNFTNIERLLLTAFEQSAEESRLWLEDRAREIAALPATPDGAASALLHVIVAWTSQARSLALIYQEALTARQGQAVAMAWTRLWRDFWIGAAEHFGLEPIDGRLLHAFFEHEALHHLSTWSPALETAALAEMIDHFAATWLDAPLRAPRNATLTAERLAGTRPHGSVPPSALRIAKAAAEVVEESGLAGLTHRAVAARANVTTGSVTHHFRSIEDLVAGAIRGQVQAMTEDAAAPAGAPPIDETLTADILFEGMRLHITADDPSIAILGRRRLFLATIRRRDLAAAGAVIRYSYGGTTRDSLARLYVLSDADILLHASVLTRLLAPTWFACVGDAAPAVSRTQLFDRIQTRLRSRLTPL